MGRLGKKTEDLVFAAMKEMEINSDQIAMHNPKAKTNLFDRDDKHNVRRSF